MRKQSFQKNEKITRTVSAHSKFKFYIIFIKSFSMMDIKKMFIRGRGGGAKEGGLAGGVRALSEPYPIDVYCNFARHTGEPYRKMGSPIGHVWWLTNYQAIGYASRTGKI